MNMILIKRLFIPSIASIVVLVHLVKTDEELGPVIVHDIDANVDVRLVAVIDPPDSEVPVQLPGVDVELEVVVAELEAGQREHHGLGGQ